MNALINFKNNCLKIYLIIVHLFLTNIFYYNLNYIVIGNPGIYTLSLKLKSFGINQTSIN